jgi:aryl carrier-like protein
MSTRTLVLAQIEQVAAEQGRTLAPLRDDLPLLETGLDSLCFAILVARLETEIAVDPFTMSDEVAFPVTVGDFVRLYETAVLNAAA